MKEEDLMIGDWVKMNAGPARITTIKEGEIHFVDRFGRGISPDCEGLPLTAEILEKNGFKKSIFRDIEGQHQWSWWRDTLTVVCLWMRELNDNPTDGWMIRIESTPAACCLKISSVHELQHCLKLCGIEKEIVLYE